MPRKPELVLLLVSLVLFVALAIWMTDTWKPLGDEPHYLLAAHSLVADRDLNLENNYAQQDFKIFLRGDTLDPHVKILGDGTQILNHDLGLAFVLALPYALGGRLGVELALALCAALLVVQMYKLGLAMTQSSLWSGVSAFVLAFAPPLVLYSTLIYPELIGALVFLWGTRTILFTDTARLSNLQTLLVALAIAALPWLSVRFLVLATLLAIFVAVRWYASRPRVLTILAFAAIGIAAYLVVNNILLSGIVPRGNPTDLAIGNLATFSGASITRGIVGWWIDPQRGTLIMAPLYILALAGIPRLLRQDFVRGLLLLSPLIILIPLVAFLGGFWIPFEVGARYFVVAFPLLAAPLALALRAGFEDVQIPWQRLAFSALAMVLLLLSLWNGALMLTDASYAYGSVVTAYSRALGTDVSPFFAGMGRALDVTPTNAPPSPDDEIVTIEERKGERVWRAAAGNAATIVQSFDLTELTVGHYLLTFRAAAVGAAPETEVLTLDIFSAEGLLLVHTSWMGRDLSTTFLQPVSLEFDNPYFDRWGSPLTLQVTTTGSAELVLTRIIFTSDNLTTWLRAGVWIAVILGIIVLLNLRGSSPASTR